MILKRDVQVAAQRADGEFISLTTMTAGDMFGEIALLTNESARTATTISNKGCELLVIERIAFETHLNNVDTLTRYIMSQFCRRIVSLTARFRDSEPATSA